MAFEWKDVGNAIAEFAPALAGVVGGAFGGGAVGTLASSGVSVLLNALGLKSDAKPDEVMEAIKASPEAALKLKEAEIEFKVKMGEQRLEEVKANLADRGSARTREVEITKATGRRDINQYILAWVIVSGFFGLTSLLVFKTVPQDSSGVVFMLFGALSAAFGGVTQYYFGSSKGSSEKTELLAQAEGLKIK